jgi:hypothetical protein
MPPSRLGGRLGSMILGRSFGTHSHATRVLARWRWVMAVVPLALALAGCGGGSKSGVASKTVPANQWTAATCDSLQRYDRATKRPLVEFQGLHLEFQYGEPKQGEVRDKQTAASEQIVKATDQLIADLNAAGAPETAHGREFANTLVSAFQELRDSVNDVHSAAEALPTGGDRADAGAELSPRIGAALAQWQRRVEQDRKASGAGLDLSCGDS